MSRYYCPYCLPRYQVQKKTRDGLWICGQCGDPLVRAPLVRPIQIFALITVSAFVIPLAFLVIAFFRDLNKHQPHRDLELVTIVPTLRLNDFNYS